MAYTTELMTFAVKRGKEERAEEWMRELVARQDECIATLDRERMHYECIFSTRRDGRLYLSWFSVQGEAGEHVKTSQHEIDRLHMEFWRECIDAEVAPEKHGHVVSFVPGEVRGAIERRDAEQGLRGQSLNLK